MRSTAVLCPALALALQTAASGQTPAESGRGAPPVVLVGQAAPPLSDLSLWYRQPAKRWLEALPVGNGRLGAMVFGGVVTERLALNESTFWSGAPSDDHESPTAREHLGEVRSLMFEGRYPEAVELIGRHMLGRRGNYGTHLPVGDLVLEMRQDSNEVRDYRRDLDLDDAVATVTYAVGDVHYTREVLASHPDNVITVHLTADRAGRVSFRARFQPTREPSGVCAENGDSLLILAKARERVHSDGETGVTLRGLIRAGADGGTVTADGDTITVTGADWATLRIALNTDYARGDPALRCREQMAAAERRTYAEVRSRHVADHRGLFRRVELDLGRTSPRHLPTDERLERLRGGADDPGLAATLFQYGRYLLIAGSREDSPLPANLQGLWNDDLACTMGWTCDFHLDINTQQNYWPAEVCNLSECHQPLFRLIESLREPGRRTARKMYGARGWVCHVFTNAWGFTAPGWGLGWGMHPTGGIWIASDLWEHYRFTGDREFLRDRAYPMLKDAARFFLDYMVEDPTHGWLVTGPSTSPENAFVTPDGRGACSESMGPTCDIVLVRDLFSSCVQASRILDVDAEYRATLEAALAKLPPLRVGKHGQLMEWLEDFEEAIPNHRHTSHLIALYPSDQIMPDRTPELAEAARVSIERRTGRADWEDVEWSRGNLICYFARLHDGDEAYRHVLELVRQDTDTDMLTFSRAGVAGAQDNIFVIDGNCAATAGIAEMLVQSQGGEIRLLPALPKAWPNGSVRGLRTRGGFEVGICWRDGALAEATVHSATGGSCVVTHGDERAELRLDPGETARVDGELTSRATTACSSAQEAQG